MTEEELKAAEEAQKAAAEQPETPSETQGDAEARIALLEAEKNKAIEEAANYKLAFLKEKSKAREEFSEEETEEERIERIISEKLAAKKIDQINLEKEALLKQLAKENKELKLAQLNKTDIAPASMGTHSEGTAVRDTTVTPEQMTAFKAKGWSDKDIERYKKNLQRYSGR